VIELFFGMSLPALWTTRKEREQVENLADCYAILLTVEQLEKLYLRDEVPADAYTQECTKLIAQFKSCWNLARESVVDVREFTRTMRLECPAALHRCVVVGVPATLEQTAKNKASGPSAKRVAEIVQHFITLMDALKLNMVAVDHVHPLLSDLTQSLTLLSIAQNGDNEQANQALLKVREWLIDLNKLKASDELSQDQVRQLLFDLENAHASFYRSLSEHDT
jgi:ESCRT-I complex subunit VPS28